jgi:hypothetical protein
MYQANAAIASPDDALEYEADNAQAAAEQCAGEIARSGPGYTRKIRVVVRKSGQLDHSTWDVTIKWSPECHAERVG